MTPAAVPRYLAVKYPTFAEDRQGQSRQCFWLTEPLTVILSTGQTITIPEGFSTDFASVPKFLWGIFPPIGDHNLADVIHDYLYTTNLVSRHHADAEFYYWLGQLRPLGRSRLDNWLRYTAVRVFGRGAYRRQGHL